MRVDDFPGRFFSTLYDHLVYHQINSADVTPLSLLVALYKKVGASAIGIARFWTSHAIPFRAMP